MRRSRSSGGPVPGPRHRPGSEGRSWPGHLILIEFPDIERARAWYESPGYQTILPLRTENSDGSAILVEGVAPGYRATDYLAKVGGY